MNDSGLLPFIQFGWTDIIDILLVSFLIYQLYKIVKGTVAIKIFVGILAIYLLWQLFEALQMELVAEILGQFIGVGVIALIIVFQQELRRFLLMIGTTGLDRTVFSRVFGGKRQGGSSYEIDIPVISKACARLAESMTGALIVVTKVSDLRLYTSSAEKIDGKLTQSLLESIFYKNSPLHDGAVIISNNRVAYARTVLPVTDREDFPIGLGTRHRAAAGVTEISDAVAIVVSEQTGTISYSKGGQLRTELSIEQLEEALAADFE